MTGPSSKYDSVYEAAYKGDYDYVKSKLDANKSLVIQEDDSGRILLHWSSLSGNIKLVTLLLELNSPTDPLDDTETTPLILAASAGKSETVTLLISKGANVNHKNSQGHSALQYSCSKGWEEITLKLLENNADINIADIRGATPLHRAASKGNLAIVKILMKFKEKLKIDFRDNYGNSALHLACEEDRQEEAKLLVQNGADALITNKDKKTPLDLCTQALLRILSAARP